MTTSNRLATIRVLAFGMLILAASSPAQERPAIAEQIGKAHGLDSFPQIEALRYTFNADFPGVKLSRSWVWEPKPDQVSYEGKDKAGKPAKVTYLRSELASQPALVQEEIDPAFVNDQYWLLFPLHVSWDGSARVEDTGRHKLPLGKGSAERVLVKYPAEGGYTPGDTWELYVGADHRIEEFIYHRGGPSVGRGFGRVDAGPIRVDAAGATREDQAREHRPGGYAEEFAEKTAPAAEPSAREILSPGQGRQTRREHGQRNDQPLSLQRSLLSVFGGRVARRYDEGLGPAFGVIPQSREDRPPRIG